MSELEIAAFLQRLNFSRAPAVNQQFLKQLHSAHIATVPFETLDIFSNKRFTLALPDIYDKIVTRHRGGYCYELSALLFSVLQGIGYDVRICNARVYDSQEQVLLESKHMILVVNLESSWLVDVGYGNGFVEPLRLDTPEPQQQGHRVFRCMHPDESYLIQELDAGVWKSCYTFTKDPKNVADFEERNHFHQTSAQSVFFRKRICMLARIDESIELIGNTFTRRTRSGKHTETIQEEAISLFEDRIRVTQQKELKLAAEYFPDPALFLDDLNPKLVP